jgi:hypothetical protein
MRRSLLVLMGVVALATAVPAHATTINPAVEYTSVQTLSDNRLFTLGYEFTTSVPMNINALGYWNDGRANDHMVGLWTDTGTLLTSTTVLGTDPVTGHFRYHDIGSFSLAPGTYVIGGQYLANNDPFPFQAVGVTTIPGYTYVSDRQLQGGGLIFPTVDTNGSYGPNGILVVDFSTSAVPEPASMLLLGTGLVGLVARRRRSNRS